MKIFSKFQDYYDSTLGSFLESDVVVHRKESTVQVPYKDIPPIGNSEFSYKVVREINGRKQYGRIPFHMIGFCGTWYFFIYAEDKEGNFTRIEYKTVDDIVKNNKEIETSYGIKYHNDFIDPNKVPAWKELFETYGPVLFIDIYVPLGKYYLDSKKFMNMTIWPQLKSYKFQAVKDPYTALWEIEHWFDTHARPDEAIVPVGDDIIRLQAYGFDKKTSFRKGKEER